MTPIACMITDRRRLRDQTLEGVVRQAAAAARSGIQLIQLRERDLEGRALVDLARRVVAAVKGTRTRVLVNDRLDVALAAHAHGVQLRQGSFGADRVRALVAPGFLIGQSVHSVDEARAPSARAADFLLFGHVFESASKPDQAPRGLAELSAVSRATPVPVLALGGVSLDRIHQVVESGAAGFAAISLFAALGAA